MDQTPERITYSVKEAAAALGVSEWMGAGRKSVLDALIP